MCRARSRRVASSQPCVRFRKIGTLPGGLTTGSSAPTISSTACSSCTMSDQTRLTLDRAAAGRGARRWRSDGLAWGCASGSPKDSGYTLCAATSVPR